MTTERFDKCPKFDGCLIMVLENPNVPYKTIKYDPRERKVGVYIESSASRIPNLNLVKPGIHSGRVDLFYVLELAEREDVTMIRAMKK